MQRDRAWPWWQVLELLEQQQPVGQYQQA